jgi:hypothetical protein
VTSEGVTFTINLMKIHLFLYKIAHLPGMNLEKMD